MEHRFGFKDLLLLVLVLIVVVMLGFKMKQDDRAWELLGQISNKVDQQTKDITGLRRAISQRPVRVEDVSAPQTPVGDDIFRRLQRVRQRPDFAEGDVWITSFQSAPPKLNNLTSHDLYARVVHTRVLEGLAEWDLEKLEMVPHLAQSWKWSQDRLSLDVQLRINVTFSDGEPMEGPGMPVVWPRGDDFDPQPHPVQGGPMGPQWREGS